MNAVGNASGIRRALLGILLVLMVGPACDSGGGMDNGDDNSPPNASVTANNQRPAVGDSVRLDASESSDPDGDELTFSWTLETPDGSNATLSAQAAVDPQFIPDTSGNYTARLIVDDGSSTDTDEASVTAEEDVPDSVTVKTTLSTTDNGTLTNCVVEFTPESGDTVRKQSCRGPSATFPKDSGTVVVNATADDYQQMEKTTSTKRNRTLEFTLKPETPDQSTVTFAVTEADTLVAAEIFVADTLAADGVEPTAVFPFEQTINARVESEFLETTQISFTTDKEDMTVAVSLQRKTAEIAITPRDDEGNLLAEAKTVIREPNNTDSTTVTGDGSVELLQLPGQRAIETRLITERADNPDRLIRYKPFSTTVSASENAELAPNMARLLACNDSISNETGESDDGRVGVWSDENGNGFADKGEGDPGCVSSDDDNEGDVTFTRSIGSGGDVSNNNRFVSSADDHRKIFWDDGPATDFPISIKDAIIINSRVEVKVQDDQDGEEFAMELACGPDNDTKNKVNLTETAADQDRDGWTNARLRGITAGWFSEGTDCAQSYLHASKIRDKPPGDGNDDVFFLVAGDDTIRFFQIQWTIEEEDDHRKVSAAGLTKHSTDSCRDTQTGKMCVSVGDPKAW